MFPYHPHGLNEAVIHPMAGLKANFFYSSILTTANYIFPLVTYPYISRILEVTNLGAINFVDSIINFFSLVSMMGISWVGIREIAAAKKDQEQLSIAFSSLITLNFITTVAVLAILLIGMYTIPALIENRELLWIGAIKLVFNLFLIEWFYKGIEDFGYITKRTIIIRIIYVVGVFIFVRDINDRNIYYFLTTCTIIISAIINILYSLRYVKYSFKIEYINIHKKSYFSVGIYSLLSSSYTLLNIAILGFIAGDTQVGYFSTGAKLFYIILALFSAFTGVMMPRMSSLVSEGKFSEFQNKIKISYNFLFGMMIPFIIFTYLLTPQIILFISGPGYEGAIIPMKIITPLLFILGYNQILIIQIMMPLKMEKELLRNSIVVSLSGLIFSFISIKIYQSIGSSLAWLISELLMLILSQIVIRKKTCMAFPYKILLKNLIYYFPLGMIIYCFLLLDISYIAQVFINGVLTIVYIVLVELFLIKDTIALQVMKKCSDFFFKYR